MATWLLVLVALAIPRIIINVDNKRYDISVIYRIILFIICCIWG